MVLEDWKIKVSVLWFFKDVALLAYLIIGEFEPGALQEFLDKGTVGGLEVGRPEILLLFAIISLVPLVMAFLTLTLKDSINRWANIVVGVVFAVLGLVDLGEVLANPSAWATLMTLSMFVAPALVVWYAWKSKQ
jgi:Ca2+/H+ antiporter